MEKRLKDKEAQGLVRAERTRGLTTLLKTQWRGILRKSSYFEEVISVRATLNSRYDDLKSGRVKPIPGDEVEAYFRDKSAAARRSHPGS